MDNKNLLMVAFTAVVGIIIVLAVLAAGCMLVSVLFDSSGPTASPTPIPTAPTLVPSFVVPSGPFIPTKTPSASSGPVVPTPVEPAIKTAELAGYGTDKDTYKRGDTAKAYITIKNTGNVVINDARLQVTVARYVSVVGYVNVQNYPTEMTDLNIRPGETKNAEYNIEIPSEYQGVSTAGDYRFTVEVYVWNNKIGTFTKDVKVQ